MISYEEITLMHSFHFTFNIIFHGFLFIKYYELILKDNKYTDASTNAMQVAHITLSQNFL